MAGNQIRGGCEENANRARAVVQIKDAWDAAWRLDAEELAGEEVAIAKYWTAAAGQFVGYAAQHLHGGIGIDVDYPLHRYYLWAKQNELALGSAPIQLERLGEQLADGTLTPGR